MPEKPRTIQSIDGRRPRPEAEEIQLRILYEDESLIAVDKPPGMVVHPTYRNWSGTLLNGLLWHVRDRAGVLPRIVTRLDKDTSGLVLVALTPEVQARIQRDTAAGRVKKEYLAIVHGTPRPPRGSIALPLARDPDDRRRVVVTPDGSPSETRYEVVSSAVAGGRWHPTAQAGAPTAHACAVGWETCAVGTPLEGRPLHSDLSLVRCELVTGRTHQIRVHLAARGWPIIGDRLYGETHEAIARQALHAWRVTLPHPVSRILLEIEAPLSPDLRQLLGSVPGNGTSSASRDSAQ